MIATTTPTKIEALAIAKGYRVADGKVYGPTGQINPSPDSKGYLRFNVQRNGKSATCWVHRLVAFQKFGEAIHAPGIDVRHLDGDHTNNADSNIAIGSRSENLRDTPAPARSRRAVRMNETKHGELRKRIAESLAAGNGVRKTARLLGCAVSTVMNNKEGAN
jgi:hypothetical protein